MKTKIKKKMGNDRKLTDIELTFAGHIRDHTANINMLLARMQVQEVFLLKNNTDVTQDSLALMIGDVMDQHLGLVKVGRPVDLEDSVRIRFRAIQEGEEKPRAEQKLTVSKVGSGETLPKLIEEALVGLSVGESAIVEYDRPAAEGDPTPNKHSAELTVDAVSCKPAAPEEIS